MFKQMNLGGVQDSSDSSSDLSDDGGKREGKGRDKFDCKWCYDYGKSGHYIKYCPKKKDKQR